ncbi:AAA family ATPase [Gulosibacter sp. 10]|uniref:AAA family ATPase n=1 Tax=Gulosibacter sp. 10 TaxID=1255570 RepID=UPI00097EDA40|nr:SMC family ATPase [Gulosibacter sp. 10]SJM65358.1 Exonuclease SbcC [Gulosibacter sp. 10]
MRLLALELRGFGPFRDPQRIDFARFDEEGLFLIRGRTGAGKSSVLDAIVYALYGSTPRYEGASKEVRSTFCSLEEPTSVMLEFEHGGARHRVTRAPEYEAAKARGTGTTVRPSAQRLERLEGATWVALATRARDVAELLAGIFPLTAGEFLQVVMLAQNKFQEFLRADSANRQRLLRTLFRTRRYERIAGLVVERAKTSGAELTAERRRLEDVAVRLRGVEADLDAAEREIDGAGDAAAGDETGAASDVARRLGTESVGTESVGRESVGRESVGTAPDDAEPRGTAPGSAADDPPLDAEWLGHLLERGEAHLADCRSREARCRSSLERASERRRLGERTLDLQRRRDAARAERAEREADRERIDSEVADRLAADERARPLLAAVAADERRRAVRSAALERLEEARAHLLEECHIEAAAGRALPHDGLRVGEPSDRDAGAPPAGAESRAPDEAAAAREAAERVLTELFGSLSDGADLDDRIESEAERCRELEKTVRELEARAAELELRRAERPEARERLAERRAEARASAQSLERADETLERLRNQEAAARALPELEERLGSALAAVRRAEADADEAERAVRERYDRRWRGAAPHLAADLRPGGPCPVCGSLEHPAPAAASIEPVSDAEIDAAEHAAAKADAELAQARERAETASKEHAARAAETGGLDIAAAAARVEAALAEVGRARDADERAAALAAEIEALDAADAEDARAGRALDRRLQEHRAAATRAAGALEQLRAEQRALRGAFDTVRDRLRRTEALLEAVRARNRAERAAESAGEEADAARETLVAALAESGFEDAGAVRAAHLEDSTRRALAEELDAHRTALRTALRALAEPDLDGLPEARVDLEPLRTAERTAADALNAAATRIGAAERLHRTAADEAERARAAMRRLDELGERAEAERQLASDLSGQNERRINLEAFVLAGHFEEIIAAANARLGGITAGRYELELDDGLAGRQRQSGLGLRIFDVYNGRSRTPASLSGGETFLVSLALALGLADVVSAQAGGIALDTMFIDEGFGSLDGDTLELAMRTLDDLRQGGRTIGVISHVRSMHERIPAQLDVRVRPDGASEIVAEPASGPAD